MTKPKDDAESGYPSQKRPSLIAGRSERAKAAAITRERNAKGQLVAGETKTTAKVLDADGVNVMRLFAEESVQLLRVARQLRKRAQNWIRRNDPDATGIDVPAWVYKFFEIHSRNVLAIVKEQRARAGDGDDDDEPEEESE